MRLEINIVLSHRLTQRLIASLNGHRLRRSIVNESQVKLIVSLLSDCADAMVNTSTRFTDGDQMGFGAEIGIFNQKLHTRGPMGLEAMTTTIWIVTGSGQIRR